MSCAIQLDHHQGPYTSRGVIMGKVTCSFNNTKNIRGIILELKGEEHNEWTRRITSGHGKDRRSRTVHYKGHETFLIIQSTLQGEGDIGPGTFEYPFTLQLPRNLPNSFQGRYGWVLYNLKVKVDRPFKIDYTNAITIHISSPINLNLMKGQYQLEPTSYSIDKTICCWCCRSDPLTMEVHLEKGAFVVGETVKVVVDITNMSNQSIDWVDVKLGTQITSMVTHPQYDSKSDYELLAASRDTGVGAHGQRSYSFALEIPDSAQVHNFNLCQLFKETTKLQVTAILPGCHTNMEMVALVAVGHIPIDKSPYKDPVSGAIGFIVPKGADAGPSAPLPEGEASAPSKMEMEEDQFGMVEPAPPPPSYSEAVSELRKQ